MSFATEDAEGAWAEVMAAMTSAEARRHLEGSMTDAEMERIAARAEDSHAKPPIDERTDDE